MEREIEFVEGESEESAPSNIYGESEPATLHGKRFVGVGGGAITGRSDGRAVAYYQDEYGSISQVPVGEQEADEDRTGVAIGNVLGYLDKLKGDMDASQRQSEVIGSRIDDKLARLRERLAA